MRWSSLDPGAVDLGPAAWPSLAAVLADPSRMAELPPLLPPTQGDYDEWRDQKRSEAAAWGIIDRTAARALGEKRKPTARPLIPPAPELSTLPLITKGPRKGERWMMKRQFVGWCGVSVATVS